MASDLPAYQGSAFEYTLPPNPHFTYGQGVDSTPNGKAWLEGEEEGWKVINPSIEDPLSVHDKSLLNSDCR